MKKLIITLILGFLLAACSSSGGDPAGTVEKYLQAKADSNEAAIRQLLCSEMESVLEREVHTFQSVSGVHLEGMACEQVGDQAVTCQGKIVATYGTEETEFPLSTYRVVEEDGEWKWCGETAVP